MIEKTASYNYILYYTKKKTEYIGVDYLALRLPSDGIRERERERAREREKERERETEAACFCVVVVVALPAGLLSCRLVALLAFFLLILIHIVLTTPLLPSSHTLLSRSSLALAPAAALTSDS